MLIILKEGERASQSILYKDEEYFLECPLCPEKC